MSCGIKSTLIYGLALYCYLLLLVVIIEFVCQPLPSIRSKIFKEDIITPAVNINDTKIYAHNLLRDTDIVISSCGDDLSQLLNRISFMPTIYGVYIYEKCPLDDFEKHNNDSTYSHTIANYYTDTGIHLNYTILPNVGREGGTFLHHILN